MQFLKFLTPLVFRHGSDFPMRAISTWYKTYVLTFLLIRTVRSYEQNFVQGYAAPYVAVVNGVDFLFFIV